MGNNGIYGGKTKSVEVSGSVATWSFFMSRRGFGFEIVSSLSLFYQKEEQSCAKIRDNDFTGGMTSV